MRQVGGWSTIVVAACSLLAVPVARTAHAAAPQVSGTQAGSPAAAQPSRPLAKEIETRRQAGSPFTSVALFGPNSAALRQGVAPQGIAALGLDAQAVANAVAQGNVLPLNARAVADLLQKGHPTITLSMPTRGGAVVELELFKHEVLAANFEVVTSDGQRFTAPPAAHYQGIVKGDPESRAALSVFENEIMGFFSSRGDYHVIGRLGGKNPANTHIVYEHHDLKWEPPAGTCGLDDAKAQAEGPTASFQSTLDSIVPQAVTPRCVQLYVETEYDIYQAYGSVSAVTNYVSGVYNQVNALYRNNETPMSALSQVYVWTSSDPYTTMSENRLYDFTGYRRSFTGTFGTLWTFEGIRSMAYDIDTYCQSSAAYRSAFCGLYGGSYSTVPTYSWTVYIIAHELGHLFGSEHTHACVWNGNNTAIDGCAGFVEYGSCSLPGNPSCGTIMSYCTYCIDFNQAFGSQPGQKIRNRYTAATCVPTCGSTVCSYTISPTSASYAASGGSGSVSVTTTTGCTWTASSSASWITVTSGASGSGSGTVGYSVATNTGTTSRTGTLTVAGRTFTVSQSAGSSVCSYTISPTSASYAGTGGSGSVSVATTTGCAWTASSGASWLTVTSGASGSGSGTVGYSVAANTGTASRTGTFTIAGRTFTVSQSGSGSTTCTTYTGTLSGTGAYQYQPNGNWYQSRVSGTHVGTLTGPSNADFDLELYKSTSTGWTRVASSAGSTSSERISYNGTAGYYYWRVVSYSGSGSYSLCISVP